MSDVGQRKHAFRSLRERQRTIEKILSLILERNRFVLLGHELPDEDCISSLVSMALILAKFRKDVTIFLRENIPDQLAYLMNICAYNGIPVIGDPDWDPAAPDVICILDTPKPDMIDMNDALRALVESGGCPLIEFDHHLSADAAWCGTPGLRLVDHATSTCELLALFSAKLTLMPGLLDREGVREMFSRNLVLSMLTGIIGDTRFGLTLKRDRDVFFYNFYTNHFAQILRESFHKNSGNYSSMDDIFKSLQSLSVEEKDLYQALLDHSRYEGSLGLVVLDKEESLNFLNRVDYSLFVKVVKSVTDFLAEKSGTFGLTAYYDRPEVGERIQFRIRVSREVSGIDLRSILLDLEITDGGGHPGAIGFRVPTSALTDLMPFVDNLRKRLADLLP